MSELEQAQKDNISELENQELDDDGLELTNNEKRENELLTNWSDLDKQGKRLERHLRVLDKMIKKTPSGDQKCKYIDCSSRTVLTLTKLADIVNRLDEILKKIEKKTRIDHRYNYQSKSNFDANRFEER